MKLVFIYGPPAAGKLTVVETLATRIGFRVFHNHLTVDLASALFDFGTEPSTRFVEQLRLEAFEVAVREQLAGLIFTYVYAAPHDDTFV